MGSFGQSLCTGRSGHGRWWTSAHRYVFVCVHALVLASIRHPQLLWHRAQGCSLLLFDVNNTNALDIQACMKICN
jgi:hypothetical protein